MGRKWWVNAPGAKPVAFDSKEAAERVRRQVRGATVDGKPKRGGLHTNSDKGFDARPWWRFW